MNVARKVLKAYADTVWPPRMPATLYSLIISALVVVFVVCAVKGGVGMAGDFLRDVKQAAADAAADRRDASHESNVNTQLKGAENHETLADQAELDRQFKEGRAAGAAEAMRQAARNSNLTVEPTQRARHDYTETRALAVDDAPAVPDADICSELGRRNIDFSQCR